MNLDDITVPKGISFDIGNVVIFPNGRTIADILEKRFLRKFDPKQCRDAFLVADKILYEQNRPCNGKDFIFEWAEYLNIDKDIALTIWENELNEENNSYWDVVDPTAESVFQKLFKLDLKLGVVSNADGKLESDLKRYKLDHYFHSVIDSKIIGIEKPDPRIYQMGIDALNLNPNQCWFIGDSLDELKGANEVGYGTAILYDPAQIHNTQEEFIRITTLNDFYNLTYKVIHK